MKINDIIKIGRYVYYILDIQGSMMLLTWTESSGIVKERWVRGVK